MDAVTSPGSGHKKRRMMKTAIPPEMSSVREVRRILEQVASLTALSAERLFDLQVVVSEACANAIEHSRAKVEVAAWLLPDRLIVEVSSPREFRARFPVDGDSRSRGLGMALMASLADQVQVSRLTRSLTRVSLTFLLEPGPGTDERLIGGSALASSELARINLLEDPRVHGLVLTSREMKERGQLEERLTWQAFHDPLTGLANRKLFLDRVENALSRASRGGTSIAVMLLDVDDFKSVNDTLGHAAGDRLLVMIGARLESLLRAGDTAARLGGDEFALLMEDVVAPVDIGSAADRLLSSLREPYELGGTGRTATVSVGIAASDPSAHSVTELLQRADMALYDVKAQGRDGWRLFDSQMLEANRAKRKREKELKRALDHEEISAHFQPIISTKLRQIVGLEALARWNHPTGNVLLPESFIGLAEDTGLILPLGYRVLKQACLALNEWDVRYPQARLQLMVNVSVRQLEEPKLIDQIVAILSDVGICTGRLVLEIHEDVLAGEKLGILETLAALRETGIRLAVDGFGAGHSSLRPLTDCRIDLVKIAKSLVMATSEATEGAALAGAILGLAKSLGIDVVAVGVEREKQLKELRSLGCDLWQGRFFSMPVPSDRVPALLETKMRL